MGLDAYITQEIRMPRIGEEYELAFQFSNDGYFWFLYPHLKELGSKTYQTIELYEDAHFYGPTLDLMRDTISQARDLIACQPDVWEEHIGTRLFPVGEKIYSTVDKKKFEELLKQWEKAVHSAKEKDAYLTFWGD